MRNVYRWKAAVFVLWLTVCGVSANASLITLSSGEEIVLNYDYSAEANSPSVDAVVVDFSNITPDSAQAFFNFFEELDASGPDSLTVPVSGFPQFGFSPSGAGYLDGAFSLQLSNGTPDTYSFTTTYTFTLNGEESSALNPRVSGPAAVPSPATLTLLGIGLAGLSWKRRKNA